MSGTVLTVASGKGGVGKTTTAVNLAVALWRDEYSVALVDADLGMANLASVLSLEPGPTLHDVLAGEATAEEAVIEAKNGDLLVLPGGSDLAGFANADPGRLQLVVENLADRVDFVIVDTGAGLSYEDVLPLGMADTVLLATTPDPAAVVDTRKTLQLAGLIETPVLGVVVTRAIEETDAEAIAGDVGTDLLGAIPEDPAVTESAIRGDPLESHAPEAPATLAYRELAETVVGRVESYDLGAVPAAEEPSTAGESDDVVPAGVDALDEEGDAGVTEAAGDPEEVEDADDAGADSDADEPEPDEAADAGDGADRPDDAADDEGADVEADDDEKAGGEAKDDEKADVDADDDGVAGADGDDGEAGEGTRVDGDDEAAAEEEPTAEDAEERRGGVLGWFGRLFS